MKEEKFSIAKRLKSFTYAQHYRVVSLFLFLLSLFTTLQAQQGRDYAKRIEFGRGADYKTCAISPSGAMWLCFSYHNDLFHTDTISTRWLAVPDSVLERERCYNDFFVVICPDSDKVLELQMNRNR